MAIRFLLFISLLFSMSAFSQEVVRIRRSWVQISDPKDSLKPEQHYYVLDRDGNRTAIVLVKERLGLSVGTKLLSGRVERGFTIDGSGTPSADNLSEFGDAIVMTGKNSAALGKRLGTSTDSLSDKKISRERRVAEYAPWVWSVYPLDVLILRFEAEIERRVAPRFAVGPHGVFSRISIAGVTAEYYELGAQGLLKFDGNWGDTGFGGGFGLSYAQFAAKVESLGVTSRTTFAGFLTYGRLFYQWVGKSSNLRLGARYTVPLLKETQNPGTMTTQAYVLSSRLGIDLTVGWNF